MIENVRGNKKVSHIYSCDREQVHHNPLGVFLENCGHSFFFLLSF
jgi:hypothetical protein